LEKTKLQKTKEANQIGDDYTQTSSKINTPKIVHQSSSKTPPQCQGKSKQFGNPLE
jgi:hypothetical protein